MSRWRERYAATMLAENTSVVTTLMVVINILLITLMATVNGVAFGCAIIIRLVVATLTANRLRHHMNGEIGQR